MSPTAKLISYKVGKASRTGYPVTGGADNLIKHLPAVTMKTFQHILDAGVVFTKAYVLFREIDKSYQNTGSGMTWTYSIFGEDSDGNEIIYDKYEGGTAGGGQSWIYINGKKVKATAYANSIRELEPWEIVTAKTSVGQVVYDYRIVKKNAI